ncbi:MAG: hypothetical protein RLZZ476_854 [Verrucomicrobiota bacterium]|jgi:recombinational DNA repair protein (RecF pathway)
MPNVLQLAQIPDDLAAEAAKVPGLPQRLLSFIRAEVAQHQWQKPVKSEKMKKLVADIRKDVEEEAQRLQEAGMTPEQAKKEFYEEYLKVMEQIEQRQVA